MSDIRWKPQTEEEIAEAVRSHAEITRLRSDLEKAKQALEYYADTFCELGRGSHGCGYLQNDCSGCRAAATLKEIEHERT